MLKRRIVTWLTGIALLAAVAGASGIVADSLGLAVTPTVSACGGGPGHGGGGGGGC